MDWNIWVFVLIIVNLILLLMNIWKRAWWLLQTRPVKCSTERITLDKTTGKVFIRHEDLVLQLEDMLIGPRAEKKEPPDWNLAQALAAIINTTNPGNAEGGGGAQLNGESC